MKRTVLRISLGLVLLATGVLSRNARASSYYLEFQGGLSQFRSGETFFETSNSSASDLGYGFNAGIFRGFSLGVPGMEVQVGLQDRISMATQDGVSYGIHAPYLASRLQFLMGYLSVGFAPLVLKNSGSIMDISMVSGAFSFLGEFGLLYPVTPKFSIGGTAGSQWVMSEGALSPSPMLDFTFLLRFYFGFAKEGAAGLSRETPEYNGWRYLGK